MTAAVALPVALVADDDPVTRRVLTMLLERQGFGVLVAGQESDRRRGAAAGVNEFLTKPFSPSKLATRLRQLSETTAR